MIIEYSHSLLLFSSLSSDSSISGIFHTLYIHHADDRWFWLNTNNGNKNDEKEKTILFCGGDYGEEKLGSQKNDSCAKLKKL